MNKITAIAPVMLMAAVNVMAQEQKRPNVIFILTDDQGYGDLGCNGNPWLKTPNIDNLERQSFSFTDFHSGTTSAPTRSGLMSGKYCNSVGVWHTIMGRSILAKDVTILPELMKKGGYSTAMFGKWHLGDYYPYRPFDRGFDEAFYHGGGGVGQGPDVWNNNYYNDTYLRNGVPEKTNGYCTDVWFAEAMKYIDGHKDKPFFVYLATNAPHGPHNVEKKYSDMYKDVDEMPDPNYCGMVTNIDDNVGRLVDYLKKNNLYENTILVFMTDNGSGGGVVAGSDKHIVKGFNAYMRGKKGSNYEGGHRVPFIMRVPGRTPKKIFSLSGYIDVMPTFLELCGLKDLTPKNIDGVSMVSLMDNDVERERYMFADTQRREYLSKGRSSCVMYKKWRLINGKELYNILLDPSQRVNVASEHPELVNEMKRQYDLWWKKSSEERADRFEAIYVGDPNQKKVLLYAHDLHNDDNKYPAWDQKIIRSGAPSIGYWALDVKKAGKYRVRFYRWVPGSGLAINAAAPAVEENWGNVNHIKEGVVIDDIKRVEVKVDHKKVKSARVNDKKEYAEVILKLDEGPCFLQGDFIRESGENLGMYYATVELL